MYHYIYIYIINYLYILCKFLYIYDVNFIKSNIKRKHEKFI